MSWFITNWRWLTNDLTFSILWEVIDSLRLSLVQQCHPAVRSPYSESEAITNPSQEASYWAGNTGPQGQLLLNYLYYPPKEECGDSSMSFKKPAIPKYRVRDFWRKQDFLCWLELKYTYFMVPVSPENRVCLRFMWNRSVYQFYVFILGSAQLPACLPSCRNRLSPHWGPGVEGSRFI